jgi:CheY-like chemotaxis protein
MPRRDPVTMSLRGIHVLLLCDDAERCALFAQALRYAGALATACASADEASAAMARVRANVLVVEVRAASERSRFITALRALPTEEGGGLPALALTGTADDRAALLAEGFQLHVTMPVHAVELCRAVAGLAEEPSAWPRL